MTIDEAIEILTEDIDDPGSVPIEDVIEAEELGIEALKRTLSRRERLSWTYEPLLPGETAQPASP